MADEAQNPHTFDCKNCGASLTFAVGTDRLECEYCGTEQAIPVVAPPAGGIREYDLASALEAVRRQPASALMEGGVEQRCEGCGARTVLEGTAGSCVYCDSPMVAVQDDATDAIVPETVLPFKVDRDKARAAFNAWVDGLWFAPGDLKGRAAADAISGVYIPYWTFDAESTSDYSGERGEHYWTNETFTDFEGRRQTRRVQKTRWYPASGRVQVPFDDVLVCGNDVLPRDLIRSLEPWDLQDLRPYDPAYLSGFVAERYAVDLQEAFKLSQERMREGIRSAAEQDIGGDDQRVHDLNTDLSEVKFKLCLLPLWLSSFRYGDEVFRFLINARTGEVAGKRPWSWWKIVFAILGALALVLCLVTCSGGTALPVILVAAVFLVPWIYKKVTQSGSDAAPVEV